MHALLQLLLFWALAFISLALAVLLVQLYSNIIDSDATLHTLGWEAVIAGVASLIEAVSVWAVVRFVPNAVRALIVPALAIALIYKICHLEDWNKYDIIMLLLFQIGLVIVGGALFLGRFQIAFVVLSAYIGCLILFAAIIRSMD